MAISSRQPSLASKTVLTSILVEIYVHKHISIGILSVFSALLASGKCQNLVVSLEKIPQKLLWKVTPYGIQTWVKFDYFFRNLLVET